MEKKFETIYPQVLEILGSKGQKNFYFQILPKIFFSIYDQSFNSFFFSFFNKSKFALTFLLKFFSKSEMIVQDDYDPEIKLIW